MKRIFRLSICVLVLAWAPPAVAADGSSASAEEVAVFDREDAEFPSSGASRVDALTAARFARAIESDPTTFPPHLFEGRGTLASPVDGSAWATYLEATFSLRRGEGRSFAKNVAAGIVGSFCIGLLDYVGIAEQVYEAVEIWYLAVMDWIYQESNAVSGLQNDQAAGGASCLIRSDTPVF
jgi:hypothetical protein